MHVIDVKQSETQLSLIFSVPCRFMCIKKKKKNGVVDCSIPITAHITRVLYTYTYPVTGLVMTFRPAILITTASPRVTSESNQLLL